VEEVPTDATLGEGSQDAALEEPPGDAVLVTVDDKSLTRSEAADLAREMAARRGVPPQMADEFIKRSGAQLEQQVVQQFVDQTLLESEAERLAISVSEEDIDTAVANLTARMPEGMTIEQALAAQGMGVAEFRKEIEANERIRKLCESKTETEEPVTAEQIETFYHENSNLFQTKETVDAKHILVACEEDADAEAQATAKAEAEAIRKQLDEGADFAQMAAEKSACPSKENGGSLGSVERGQMVPPFEQAAFSQEVGKIGPVVKTRFGYHVILVTGKQPAGVQPLEDVREDIRGHLAMQRREKLLDAYLDTLREQADITYPGQKPQGDR
jgi:peptidyl-prolyl cis-trans isomerase C